MVISIAADEEHKIGLVYAEGKRCHYLPFYDFIETVPIA